MSVAEIIAPLVEHLLSYLKGRLLGLGHAADKAEQVVADLREEITQLAIKMRFAEMDLALLSLEAQRAAQKVEEEAALARGRANALPDVTIVPPDGEDQ